MKKTLLLIGCIVTALISGSVNAQINYQEDFEDGINWSGSEFFDSTTTPCEGNHSYVSDLHGGFVSNGSDVTVSPSLGTSNGTPVTLGYNYKVLNSMTGQGVLNSANWGSITVSWGTSSSGPWTPLETINPSNHTESSSCAERTLTFTPAAGTQVYVRVATELFDFSNFIHIYIDDITAVQQTFSPDWVNLQWPSTMELDFGQTGTVYAQVYEPGLTEAAGAGAGISAWIGINNENTDPSTWTTWIPAAFNVQAGNNDEYMATIGAGLQGGTYYYASRFQLENGAYIYGGINGIWNGTTNLSGVLTVNCNTTAPSADAVQEFCNGSTVVELEAEGDEIVWYTAITGGFPVPESTVLADGITYYAAQIPVGGCESMERTAVTIEVITVPTPTGDSTQEFTNNDEMPVGRPFSILNIETQEGAIVKWYFSEEEANNGINPHAEDDMFYTSGTYYVTQTIDGCESEPFAVAVDITLGSEGFTAGAFTYYPNPVNNVLNLSYTELISSVEVYNLLGQCVITKSIDQNEVVLDMGMLSAGTYMVKVTSGEDTKTFKLVKK